jgi:arylsulfatase A-like enzyme
LFRLSLFAVLACATLAWSDEPRPNVVLIVADDLGWADLECYGSTFHSTPHLDRLAADGMRFTDAYAACPVCSPSRAALMTGCYPQRFQITDWLPGRGDRPDQRLNRPKLRQELPLEAVTLAEVLKDAGYVTVHIGKWHLGGKGFSPREQGFDRNIGGDQTGTPRSYFAPFRNKDGVMPGLEDAPEGQYLTDRYALEAEQFIAANKERPFFLYLPHNGVHTPLRAKQEMIDKYPQEGGLGKQSNPVYAAMLESVDDSVGRIVAKLDELKLTDHTLILFTSDNGGLATLEGMKAPATFNGPLREGKGYLYEGGIRVPLLVKLPKTIAAGKTNSVPVSSQDLLPTICEICQVKPLGKIDGRSFAPQLKGSNEPVHDALYWHYPHYANQGSEPGGAIRENNFKLIEYYENGRRELFNVKSDVSESRNLAAEQPELVARLAKRLDDWRKDVGALMPTPNPDFVPNPPAADGTITMHARTAEVHGVMLRFEPLPHKDTLGFWVNEKDYATFEFTVREPGKFVLEAWQGCGGGQGGSVVEFSVGDQKLEMTVEDTGHFQNFKPREVGQLSFEKPGRYTLSVKAKTKAKAAVMDLRQVVLKLMK